MFNSDQPIESKSQDSLGRDRFADSLSKAIFSHTDKNSLVIGLYGDWGSGKTSLLNLFIKNIESSKRKNKPITVRFNPWNFADQNQLILQFFQQLNSTLKRKDYFKKAEKIGQTLETYASLFEPLSIILPGSSILKNIGNAIKNWGSQKKSDLNTIRSDLNKYLKSRSQRILVIIDDIDRLPPEEIRQVFQVVKKIADFPNTMYLLAFDKKVVLDAFRNILPGSEQAYLEKIVQVPFEIPPITEEELKRYLFDGIEKIFADSQIYDYDRTHWTNIYQNGFKDLFTNLREINRYLNTLGFSFDLAKKDVYPSDFLAITTIQVFLPKLYYDIRDNIDLFTEKVDYAGGKFFGDKNDDLDKERLNQIYNKVEKMPIGKLDNIMDRIFPTLVSRDMTPEEFHERRRSGRICISDNFYNYFKLSVLDFDISQEEIKKILSFSEDSTAFKNTLLRLNKEGRIIKFLDRLHDYKNDDELSPISNIEPMVHVLVDLGDFFPKAPLGAVQILDGAERSYLLVNDLLMRLDDPDKRFMILKDSFQKANDSLYTPIFILNRCILQIKDVSKSEGSEEVMTTLSDNHIEQLKFIACEKIQLWADDGRLSDHIELKWILGLWQKWQEKDIVQDYIEKLTSTDEGLIKFLGSFVYINKKYQYTDYVGEIEWNMDLDALKKYVQPEKIKNRVIRIFNSEVFGQLNDKSKKAIELFLNI